MLQLPSNAYLLCEMGNLHVSTFTILFDKKHVHRRGLFTWTYFFVSISRITQYACESGKVIWIINFLPPLVTMCAGMCFRELYFVMVCFKCQILTCTGNSSVYCVVVYTPFFWLEILDFVWPAWINNTVIYMYSAAVASTVKLYIIVTETIDVCQLL